MTTATVETLTAEVRVLMVGNRQVTLSVAKQLDYVAADDIEPFGRVNLGREPVVIGRHVDSGSLVLARYSLSELHAEYGVRHASELPPEIRAECREVNRKMLALPLIVLAGLK